MSAGKMFFSSFNGRGMHQTTRAGVRLLLPNCTSRTNGELERSPKDLAGIRILVIMPSIPVFGMERANLQIMKMMRQRGAEILFVTDRNHGRELEQEIRAIDCGWEPAAVGSRFEERLHLPKSLKGMAPVARAWGRAGWEIYRIHNKFHPTHIHVTNLSYFLQALPVFVSVRQPVVFRLPNPPDILLSGWRRILSNWIWRRLVAPVSDVMICNSRYTLSLLRKTVGNIGNARVIYNCLPERGSSEPSDIPEIDCRRLNLVYVGGIRTDKGMTELVAAFRRLAAERDDVDLYLAGEYEWKNPFAEKLIQDIKASHLKERISFLGEVHDIFGLLARCHLHICPSVSAWESFPNVLLEAKSRSLPSVVFPTAGIPEAVTHLVDGYVCRDKSAEALYEGMKYFLDNPAALQLAAQAAEQSLQRFSRERCAEAWAQLFRTVHRRVGSS